jgi:hypothetical protein
MSDVQAVPPPPRVPPPSGTAFDFARPFTYVFEDPRWMQKVLMGGLFQLAAALIIGWFFILGYLAQLTRNIIRGDQHPLPEWENLGEFFNEGLRLVGVGLCFVLPIMLLVVVFMVPIFIAGASGNDTLGDLGGVAAGCLACLIVPLSLAVTFFMPASLLFAIVEQRFGAAFEYKRIWPFIKANIGNYLLAVVVYLIARTVGGFGIILLCIGVFFTAFWALLVTCHGFAQVYRIAVNKPAQ